MVKLITRRYLIGWEEIKAMEIVKKLFSKLLTDLSLFEFEFNLVL